MSRDIMCDQKSYYPINAKLCRLVQANPCMYDRSSPNYPRKDYVDRAWANIAKELNDSVGSCKERWRNIRTAYARSVNIYKTPAGPNRHKRYYLHDELHFLTKHIAPGLPSLQLRVLTPTETDDNKDTPRQSVDETDDNCTYEMNLDSSSPPPTIHHAESPPPTVQHSEEEPDPDYDDQTTRPNIKRRKPAEIDNGNVTLHSQRDPDLEFLNSLLPEMKAMNGRQKILFKGKIFRALQEVFDDYTDFPRSVETTAATHSSPGRSTQTCNKSSVMNGATMPNPFQEALSAESDALTRPKMAFNQQVPMVSLGPSTDVNIKRECINLDE